MISPRTPLSVLLLALFVSASVLAQTLLFQGRVVSVTNGDTVTVLTQSNTEFQVRCRGINAPKGTEPFATSSRQRLTDLLLDEAVTVRDVRRDINEGLVGTIFSNGRDVCLDQVRAGMAWYADQSDHRRAARQQYADAEFDARNNRFGLWSRATAQSNITSPDSVNSSSDASISPTNTDQPRLTAPDPNSSDTIVDVRGYFRKDGTYVAAHKRTAPDGNFNNNWSTQGNVNPFTGKVGTKRPSRWITALKWVGIGATLAALVYLNARYPSTTATARCNDGTYSYSQHRQGTCSYHGGVRYWLR